MKLKKGAKRIIAVIMILLVIMIAFLIYRIFFSGNTKKAKEVKVVSEIKEYGYVLNDNDSEAYKKLYKELEKILSADEVDEEKYVKKISEMFVLDFYTLSDKDAKTDVGGAMFVHQGALTNFLMKAENTIYKYVENDIYGTRKQELPTVDEVNIEKVEQVPYSYQDTADDSAYQVSVSWTYQKDLGYQDKATLTFVHEGKKLSLIVLE